MPKDDLRLPEEVNALIDGLVRRAGSRRVQHEVRRELEAHFEDALEAVPAEEIPRCAKDLVSEFGDSRVLGSLIRRAKRRCRPPLERFVILSLKVMFAAIVLAVAVALVQGRVAEREFRTSLIALEKDGLISDPFQLRSTRPAGTVYFGGPAEESAAAFLISLNDQPEDLFKDVASVCFEETHGDPGSDKERIRELLGSLGPLMEKARVVAAMPATPMDEVVKLVHFEGPVDQRVAPSFPAMDLGRSFLVEACVRNSDGQLEEALKSVETALQLSGHMRDFPLLVPQIMGLATEASSFQVLGWMEGLGESSDAATALFLPHAARVESERAALAQALTAESLNGRKLFHTSTNFMTYPNHEHPQPFRTRASNWFINHLYFTPLFRFMSAPDELGYFTRYHEIGKSLKGSYYSMQEQWRQIRPWKELPRTRTVTRLIAANITGLPIEQAACEARAALALTAINLERYKHVNGRYPRAFSELGPAPRPHSYIDPYTGRPLAYVPSGDLFLLYSVGPDGQDGGGSPDNDDIVWGK